jgi:plastocyanin
VAVVTAVHAGGDAAVVEGAIVEVAIKDFKFQPAKLTIKAGTTVRWVNREKRQYHSVWFEQLGEPEPDYFFPEESYERTFVTPGEFPYRCGPHPRMRGEIRVTE